MWKLHPCNFCQAMENPEPTYCVGYDKKRNISATVHCRCGAEVTITISPKTIKTQYMSEERLMGIAKKKAILSWNLMNR